MWISRKAFENRLGEWEATATTALVHQREAEVRVQRFESENAQLRATQEWMKLRLNHVELERAQLISAAIGVKVSIPEFLLAPASDPAKALSEMPDISTVGGDAHDDEPEGRPTMDVAVDYSMLPGYRTSK